MKKCGRKMTVVMLITCLIELWIIIRGREALERVNDTAMKRLDNLKLYRRMLLSQSSLENNLQARGITHVAIYGYGEIGTCLYSVLNRTGIEIDYVIDRNPDVYVDDCDVYNPEMQLPDTQLIIIATVCGTEQIKEYLMQKTSNRIISIDEIV